MKTAKSVLSIVVMSFGIIALAVIIVHGAGGLWGTPVASSTGPAPAAKAPPRTDDAPVQVAITSSGGDAAVRAIEVIAALVVAPLGVAVIFMLFRAAAMEREQRAIQEARRAVDSDRKAVGELRLAIEDERGKAAQHIDDMVKQAEERLGVVNESAEDIQTKAKAAEETIRRAAEDAARQAAEAAVRAAQDIMQDEAAGRRPARPRAATPVPPPVEGPAVPERLRRRLLMLSASMRWDRVLELGAKIEEVGDPVGRTWVTLALAEAHLARGEDEAAADDLRHVEDFIGPLGAPRIRDVGRGGPEDVAGLLAKARELTALGYMLRGRPGEAVSWLEAAIGAMPTYMANLPRHADALIAAHGYQAPSAANAESDYLRARHWPGASYESSLGLAQLYLSRPDPSLAAEALRAGDETSSAEGARRRNPAQEYRRACLLSAVAAYGREETPVPLPRAVEVGNNSRWLWGLCGAAATLHALGDVSDLDPHARGIIESAGLRFDRWLREARRPGDASTPALPEVTGLHRGSGSENDAPIEDRG